MQSTREKTTTWKQLSVISIWFTSPLAANKYEQAAFTAEAGEDHDDLLPNPLIQGGAIGLGKQIVFLAQLDFTRRNRIDELDIVFVKPRKHLIEAVAAFDGVNVLVADPRLHFFARVGVSIA